MTKHEGLKEYDLENRTRDFALAVRLFIGQLPKNTQNFEDGKQLIRSSGSVGANYIEANESLSKKDFVFRVKIARKEAKETTYWLSLIDVGENVSIQGDRERLIQESKELRYILSAILKNANT